MTAFKKGNWRKKTAIFAVIIVILSGVYFLRMYRFTKSFLCSAQLQQIASILSMYHSTEESMPPDLEILLDYGNVQDSKLLYCPIRNTKYIYNFTSQDDPDTAIILYCPEHKTEWTKKKVIR